MMSGPEAVRCAVLVGGQGRRMGVGASPKPLLRVPETGPTLIERVVRALAGIDAEPLIAGRRGWELPDALTELPEIGDNGRGPLGGVVAALETVTTPLLLVTACDMPFIDPTVADLVVGQARQSGRGACPVLAGSDGDHAVQPLLAVYRRAQLADMRSLEHAGVRSLREVAARLEMSMVELARDAATDRCFMNVNTPEDLTVARRIAAG